MTLNDIRSCYFFTPNDPKRVTQVSEFDHTVSVQEVESQPGPSTSNMIQEDEVVEQRNVSIDEPEADSSDRLDNTVLIKSAVIGKDDKDKRKRRRELMDYDDRQRTIKLINNFSEEQINRLKNNKNLAKVRDSGTKCTEEAASKRIKSND